MSKKVTKGSKSAAQVSKTPGCNSEMACSPTYPGLETKLFAEADEYKYENMSWNNFKKTGCKNVG